MSDEQKLVLLAGGSVFGLLLGSFLNVCIFRLPRQCMSIWRQTRSKCPKCRTLIAWYDNIPVFSWLALGGRCRNCSKPISPRYVLVELLTGATVAWLTWGALYPESWSARLSGYAPASVFEDGLVWASRVYLAAVLIVSTFIDFEFKILPDETNTSGLLAGFAICTVFPVAHLGGALDLMPPFVEEVRPLKEVMPALLAQLSACALGAAAGAGSTHVIRVFGGMLFGREAMGFGDVKLMGFLGAWLGWRAILLTFMLGCLFGSLYGILQFPFTRRMKNTEIAFGPFLALGALLFVLGARGVERALAAFMDLTRAWADWTVSRGPLAMAAFLAIPAVILAWMLVRIWKRGHEGNTDDHDGNTSGP